MQIQRLSDENFKDYERLTGCQADGGCYCAFWHQKWTSMGDWQKCQKETPEINREMVRSKMKSNFHVGVLAYDQGHLVAWISVGPLIEFYWPWRRVISIGERAKTTAGIMCISMAEDQKGKGNQRLILETLKSYGATQGWTQIEGYPFTESAYAKQGHQVLWPGTVKGFLAAGFARVGSHWLSQTDWERDIYSADIEPG